MITVVHPGAKVSLRDLPTDARNGYSGKDDPQAIEDLAKLLARLSELQERLMAGAKQSLLVVLQAMDAAGKDGVLRKVAGPLDSRGVSVYSFKAPAGEEAGHDYLWRVHARCPRKGELTLFNRSHYEDVLVVRVLDLVPKARWSRRFDHINAFEEMLHDEGTRVVKIFLHISKAEQGRRLQERLDIPEKNWKFDPRDLDMRAKWDDFQEAYEDCFERTSTQHAPWHIVSADRKWARDIAVARLLVETLEDMDPQYPEPNYDPKAIKILP